MTARPGKWTPSISWRIGAALAIVAISVFGAVAAYAYGAILRDYEQHDALELRSKAELVRRVLAQAGSAADIPAAGERLREVVLGHRGLSLVIFDQAGRLLLAVPDVGLPSLPPEHGSDAEAIEAFSSRGAAGLARYRILRGRVAPSGDAARFALVLDVSMEADLAARHLRSIGLAATAGAALSAVLGVLIVRRQLRPLAAVTAEARRVSASNLEVDLPIAGLPGELRALAEAFNDMLASLRASFARLTAFSADLAHELRTPLANMIGLAQVTLARSRTASEYREALESNVEELERLARMVADMLFLARMDQPAAPLRRERFDLAAEARHVAQYFEALLEDRRVSVEVSGRGEVSADRDMVRRALTNLLSNAIRHTPAGGRIEVSVRSAAGRVALAVRNPGPGIPPEHLPRVFDRFYRLDPSRTGSGAGLGLALVKSIVLAHGGRIDARSEPGLYTAFAFQIPANADAGKAEGGTRTRAAAGDALRRG